MGYAVKMTSVDAAYEQYIAFGDPEVGSLAHALAALSKAIGEIRAMKSFKGEAAEALKSYLANTHAPLIEGMLALVGQLQFDYAVSYMKRVGDAPISESAHAVLPEDEMEQKRGLLAQAKDERIPAIGADLARVAALLPEGPWPTIPASDGLQAAFTTAHDDVERVKNEVRSVEEQGMRLFGWGTRHFDLIETQLRLNIADSLLDAESVQGYVPGSYPITDACLALTGVSNTASLMRERGMDALIAAHDQMIERQVIREEEKRRICEEGRAQWELLGIAGSVAATLAGVVAVVASGGVAAALVAGAGTLKSGADSFERIQDLIANKNAWDNPEGDDGSASSKSKVSSSSVAAVASLVGPFLKGKGDPVKVVSGSVKLTASLTGQASHAVTALADGNHDRMREEAKAHMRRIEELDALRMAPTSPAGQQRRAAA